MNQQSETPTNQAAQQKLEWLKPTFELLQEPEGAFSGGTELSTSGNS